MESNSGLFEMLAKIKTKPGMYIGHSSVSDLFVFLAGYKTARRELGINPTERELLFYESFHEFVQNCYQIHSSKSWAKIIMLYCSDERQGFVGVASLKENRFFELLEKFETRSEYRQQPKANLIEA
jgi:hypothetical protein